MLSHDYGHPINNKQQKLFPLIIIPINGHWCIELMYIVWFVSFIITPGIWHICFRGQQFNYLYDLRRFSSVKLTETKTFLSKHALRTALTFCCQFEKKMGSIISSIGHFLLLDPSFSAISGHSYIYHPNALSLWCESMQANLYSYLVPLVKDRIRLLLKETESTGSGSWMKL